MKRTWTIIGVSDVPGSFKWYQALFGQPVTLPSHDFFGQILDSDGTVLLCLHKWGSHEHASLMNPITGRVAMGFYCSSVSMISTRYCKGHAQHSNRGVLTPRPGWILRYDQCALRGLRAPHQRDRRSETLGPSLRAKPPIDLGNRSHQRVRFAFGAFGAT
jgi:hypothetical protein